MKNTRLEKIKAIEISCVKLLIVIVIKNCKILEKDFSVNIL